MPNITKWKKFTKEELEQFVKESNSLKELAQKCGYSSDQGRIAIKEMLKQYGWEEPKQSIDDLTNQIFGKLTVLYRAEDRYDCYGHKKIYWHCKCECGNEIDVYGEKLKIKEIKSCGCLRSEQTSNNFLKIIPKGTKIGNLTILELLPERKNGRTFYKCQCDCGNLIKVSRYNLTKENGTQSCGCIKSKGENKISQILRENNISFEVQKIFNNCRFPKTNYLAKFDFWVDNKYIIEYDGIQHFQYSDYSNSWDTKEKFQITQEHDNFKNQYCKNNNIPIIRIPYTHLNDLCLEDLLLETSKFKIT